MDNKDLLNDPEKYLQEKYNLKKQWLPTIIKKHIFKHEPIDKKKAALNKIDQMLEKTEFLLECDGKSIEKRKEYNGFFHFSFKEGDRAAWIARDIVKLMNAEERIKNGNQVIYKKLNPGEYNLLQSMLAYFTKNKEEIESFYKRFKIKERHPFLKYVRSDEAIVKGTKRAIGIKKYFKRYLQKREYWLERLKESLTQGTLSVDAEEFSFIDFYKTRFNKVEELKNYAKNLLKKNEEQDFIHPVYVPNDLFTDEIKKWTVIEKPSAARMITEDTKAIGKQWFYKEQNHESLNEQEEKEQEKRKKQFRYERMKDAVLWMMIQRNIEDDATLKNALQSLTLNNYKLPGTTEKDNIFDIEVEIGIDIPISKNGAIKVKGKRKLKDYGAYRHFLKDKRIPHLLYYYKKMGRSSIEIDIIEEELQYLSRYSIETLKKIFDFEKQLIEKDEKLYKEVLETELKYNDGKVKKEKGIPSFSLHLCKYRKKYSNTFSGQDIENICEIRNKLLHNQVPQLDFDLKPDELVCRQFFDKIDDVLQKAVNTL